MARKPVKHLTIALDIETTKAQFDVRPTPICVCLYSDVPYINVQFWGADCIAESHAYLAAMPQKGLVIAHNGGKFDFGFYELDPGKMRVIGSRLLESQLAGHKTLDTFLLMPTSLKNLGAKWETDLETHHLDAPPEHRTKILDYCTQDCKVLLEAYRRFCKVFTGDEFKHCKPTAAANAFRELKKTLPDANPTLFRTTGVYDEKMREYYHGGIVNTFGKSRDLTGEFTMVDANSMYPAAMLNAQHPASNRFVVAANPKLTPDGKLSKFGDRIFFIKFDGYSSILPHVGLKGLEYDVVGQYSVTSHELQAALKYGLVRVDKIIEVLVFADTCDFSEFVETYYQKRMDCKAQKDPIADVYKIVLNSAYGKFGQNPENYAVNQSTDFKLPPEPLENHSEWRLAGVNNEIPIYFWECEKVLEKEDANYINVAAAASITGAARACLIEAIGAVISAGGCVHYCDTDSIVFEGKPTMQLGDKLGQWKIEAELSRVVIAAPKLYALEYADKPGKFKVASKGVRVKAEEIISLVNGKADITYYPEVGSHNYKGEYRTVRRTIKRETIGV